MDLQFLKIIYEDYMQKIEKSLSAKNRLKTVFFGGEVAFKY